MRDEMAQAWSRTRVNTRRTLLQLTLFLVLHPAFSDGVTLTVQTTDQLTAKKGNSLLVPCSFTVNPPRKDVDYYLRWAKYAASFPGYKYYLYSYNGKNGKLDESVQAKGSYKRMKQDLYIESFDEEDAGKVCCEIFLLDNQTLSGIEGYSCTQVTFVDFPKDAWKIKDSSGTSIIDTNYVVQGEKSPIKLAISISYHEIYPACNLALYKGKKGASQILVDKQSEKEVTEATVKYGVEQVDVKVFPMYRRYSLQLTTIRSIACGTKEPLENWFVARLENCSLAQPRFETEKYFYVNCIVPSVEHLQMDMGTTPSESEQMEKEADLSNLYASLIGVFTICGIGIAIILVAAWIIHKNKKKVHPVDSEDSEIPVERRNTPSEEYITSTWSSDSPSTDYNAALAQHRAKYEVQGEHTDDKPATQDINANLAAFIALQKQKAALRDPPIIYKASKSSLKKRSGEERAVNYKASDNADPQADSVETLPKDHNAALPPLLHSNVKPSEDSLINVKHSESLALPGKVEYAHDFRHDSDEKLNVTAAETAATPIVSRESGVCPPHFNVSIGSLGSDATPAPTPGSSLANAIILRSIKEEEK